MSNMTAASITANAQPELPDMPTWIIHSLAGIYAFVLLLAGILVLVQFPQSSDGFTKWLERRRSGFHDKLRQDDTEFIDFTYGGRSSALEGSEGSIYYSSPGSTDTRASRTRRAMNLRVNTNIQYRRPAIPRPTVSEFFHTARTAIYATPSTAFFYTPENASSPPTPLSTIHYTTPVDILSAVSTGISHAAERLAKLFHDQVTAPEEGLLLPVRDDERQGELVAGIFVE